MVSVHSKGFPNDLIVLADTGTTFICLMIIKHADEGPNHIDTLIKSICISSNNLLSFTQLRLTQGSPVVEFLGHKNSFMSRYLSILM